MNTEYFIARRFIKNQKGNRKYTTPIIRLSVIAIAVSLAVMILSVSIVIGFKTEIRNKVIGFGGHIQISNFDSNNSYENNPIDRNLEFFNELKKLTGVQNIQAIATKPALIKTKSDIQGVFLKGIDVDFDTSFFTQNIKEGRMVRIDSTKKTNEILISRKLSDLLNLKLGNKIISYFIDRRETVRPVNQRVFQICGIYQTSLETFDEKFIFGDIKHIQTLNDWENYQIGGFELLIDDYDNLDYLTWETRNIVESRFLPDGSQLQVSNIRDKNPHIFDWLELLDMNVIVILIIMIGVAIIDMISGLIILILDRTPSIGLLKSLGMDNFNLGKIFLYQAGYLIIQGLIYGNIIALVIIFMQDKFHFIKLDQTSYFIDYVPVNFSLWHLLIINFGALTAIFTFMLLPVIIVSRIEPVKTLRYS